MLAATIVPGRDGKSLVAADSLHRDRARGAVLSFSHGTGRAGRDAFVGVGNDAGGMSCRDHERVESSS